MTRETYEKASSIISRINDVENVLSSLNNRLNSLKESQEDDSSLTIEVDRYQKILDELNYKLYHLN